MVAAAEAGVVCVEEGVQVQEQRVAGAGAGEQHQGGDGEEGPHGDTFVPRPERVKGSRWCL